MLQKESSEQIQQEAQQNTGHQFQRGRSTIEILDDDRVPSMMMIHLHYWEIFVSLVLMHILMRMTNLPFGHLLALSRFGRGHQFWGRGHSSSEGTEERTMEDSLFCCLCCLNTDPHLSSSILVIRRDCWPMFWQRISSIH